MKYEGEYGLKEISWLDVYTHVNPHDLVKYLEVEAKFGAQAQTPPTNKRAIAYRLIARILTAHLDERYAWQAVTAEIPVVPEQNLHTSAQHEFAAFSTAKAAVPGYLDKIGRMIDSAPLGEPLYWHQPMWFVLKDLESLLVMDEAGFAHLRDAVRLNLLALYQVLDREIDALAALVLMEPMAARDLSNYLLAKKN